MPDRKAGTALTRRELLGLSLGATIALAGPPAVFPAAPASSPRPNILFLMGDQHRADCLGADGNRAIRTPHLDAIAREGILFRRAYSSTPTCTPARAALLTGLSPWHHGMIAYGRVGERYAFEKPRALREAGYYAMVIGKCHFHPQRAAHGYHAMLLDESKRAEEPGFVSEYRAWFDKQAPGRDPYATGLSFNGYRAKPYVLPEELHPTRWTGDRAVEFLENYNRAEPFFLKVSFARPHSPYDPPQRLFDAYAGADLPDAVVGRWAAKFAPGDPSNEDSWHGEFGAAVVRRARQGYYGSVTFLDEQIGRILDALRRSGRLDNTLILYTSDHGDMTGDHHLWRKSYPYESSARIPMLVRWPAALAPHAARGQVADAPVELRDVPPTFLEAAGVRAPESLDGRSLLAVARGESGWRPWIDLEHGLCYDKVNHWNALTDGREKYIFHALDGAEQLFELREDPGERNDLAGDGSRAARLREWRERMVGHLAERGERFVKNGRLVARPGQMIYSPHHPGCSCHPPQTARL